MSVLSILRSFSGSDFGAAFSRGLLLTFQSCFSMEIEHTALLVLLYTQDFQHDFFYLVLYFTL